jgi:8-oxo-dGTP pyrophosphatase MutT (NUDIX family)
VLLLIVGGETLVLTRRASHLSRHAGQISCPGGVREARDPDLQFTALRETHEEIGLEPSRVTVLGQLDDVWTPSGFVLTPYVGVVEPPVSFRPTEEVAEILSVPLDDLLDPAVYELEERWLNEQKYILGAFVLPQARVWGATARLIQRLLEVGFDWKAPL